MSFLIKFKYVLSVIAILTGLIAGIVLPIHLSIPSKQNLQHTPFQKYELKALSTTVSPEPTPFAPFNTKYLSPYRQEYDLLKSSIINISNLTDEKVKPFALENYEFPTKKYKEEETAGLHRIEFISQVSSSNTGYWFDFFINPNGISKFRVELRDGSSKNYGYSTINFSSFQISNIGSIEKALCNTTLSKGWYYCSLKISKISDLNFIIVISIIDGSDALNYMGDSHKFFEISNPRILNSQKP